MAGHNAPPSPIGIRHSLPDATLASAPFCQVITHRAHMKFCSECAQPVSLRVPPDDNRPRYVCDNCGTIHYQNPKLVVGSIPVWEADGKLQILLCKRAIEPRYGFWTLPAGFMENGETTEQAALRETSEEAGANIELHPLF